MIFFHIGLVGLSAQGSKGTSLALLRRRSCPHFFNYWVFRLYKHQIPTHSKRAPTLVLSRAPPIVLPRALAFGANKLSKFRQFHRVWGESVKGIKNMWRTGVTQPPFQPRRLSTQVTSPTMNNKKIGGGVRARICRTSPRLHFGQEKVKLASCTSGCLESCDFPSGV